MRLAIFFTLCCVLNVVNAYTITIAVPPFTPPFIMSSDNKNHFSGFDVDLMSEICKRINATCTYKSYPSFKALVQGGLTNEFDLAIGGIIITPERSNLYIFTLPDLKSTGQYMTRYGEDIKNIEDIPGKTVGVAESTVFEIFIRNKYADSINIKTYSTLTQVLEALDDGEVDVVLLNGLNVQYWVANSDNLYKTIGKPFTLGLGYAFLAQKKDQNLVSQINKALLDIENDGTYLKIYKTYF